MEYYGKTTDNETEIAQMFNDFFASVFTMDDHTFSIDNFLNGNSLDTTLIDPITPGEVHVHLVF